jgi:hypothetical protein
MILDISNYNRGTIALQKGKLDKAMQFFKRETNEFKELYLNMANVYRMTGMNAKAWQLYDRANSNEVLDLDGVGGLYPNALGNMGLLAYQEGSDALAISMYRQALSIDPLHLLSIWNLSLAYLRDYCSGGALHPFAWKMHEYRFKAVKAIDRVAERWDGVSHVDKIIVLAEQGMGDKLMYGRYLSLVAGYCSELWVQCPAEMDNFFSAYKTCRTVEESGCTVGIPFGCLPEIFGVVLGVWIDRPRSRNAKFTVAVEWSGSKTHLNDKNRSCYAGYFSMLAKKLDVRFINVRPDSQKIAGVEKVLSKSWADSAAIIAGCDLVVSVDTSLVHLAGSMGVPCLMMQPLADTDFRWGNPLTKAANGIDLRNNIWYSSVEVLDNIGWEAMFDTVEIEIRAKEREWFKLQMLGGLTPSEFVEKYKETLCLQH